MGLQLDTVITSVNSQNKLNARSSVTQTQVCGCAQIYVRK
jgi:hypothetical protein